MQRKLFGLATTLLALWLGTGLAGASGDKKGDVPPKIPLWPDGAPGAVG